MASQESKASLSEVQANVRADHARIRELFEAVNRAVTADAGRTEPGASKNLKDAIWELFVFFDAHLAREERELVPLLVDMGVWGNVPVERLRTEHRQQRTALLAMVAASDSDTLDSAVIADDARWLITSLRRDMDHEELTLDTVRDDGFVADQFTG